MHQVTCMQLNIAFVRGILVWWDGKYQMGIECKWPLNTAILGVEILVDDVLMMMSRGSG